MDQSELQIYFAGAIRGGRDDARLYTHLIRALDRFGRVLTQHVGDSELLGQEQSMSETAIFERDMKWLRAADLVIAEVTTPSLGVGYEIAQALAWGKPTLCLFRPPSGRALSALIAGNPALRVKNYVSQAEATALIEEFIRATMPQITPAPVQS